MNSICFYFQVHQPFRMNKYTVFDIGQHKEYFDEQKNKEIVKKVAEKCYLPANKIILDLIKQTKGTFRIAFSISGVCLEQFELYCPQVIESFKELAKTGCVEFLNETYYHSLASLYSKEEFLDQIQIHKEKIKKIFGKEPKVFRNTELIYNNTIAKQIDSLNFLGILAEGADHVLEGKSPNFIYKPASAKKVKLLLKNYKLSDDIAFRFSNKDWTEYPLTPEKFISWIQACEGTTINLFMDYETFGEHQWNDTGIFTFLKEMSLAAIKAGIIFKTPTELSEEKQEKPLVDLDIPHTISWADMERDTSAWMGNKMQKAALETIYDLEKEVKEKGDAVLLSEWRKLQTSDHFYYMCTKYFSDGDVHKYFNPYDSPYDSFLAFMNIINDFKIKLETTKKNNVQTVFQKIKTTIS